MNQKRIRQCLSHDYRQLVIIIGFDWREARYLIERAESNTQRRAREPSGSLCVSEVLKNFNYTVIEHSCALIHNRAEQHLSYPAQSSYSFALSF